MIIVVSSDNQMRYSGKAILLNLAKSIKSRANPFKDRKISNIFLNELFLISFRINNLVRGYSNRKEKAKIQWNTLETDHPMLPVIGNSPIPRRVKEKRAW